VGSVALLVIPHLQHRKGGRGGRGGAGGKKLLERLLLGLVSLGFLLPLIWVATPVLALADYPLRPAPYITGIILLAAGLWLLHRSHATLGENWSISLELRERHELVTRGIYRRVRHPMYLALLVYSLGQALVLPNWIAGPSYGVAFSCLLVFRLGREERIMLERFGKDYEAYMERTRRLIPGVW